MATAKLEREIMSQLAVMPNMVQAEDILVASSIAHVSAQHFTCNKCSDDEVSLNAPSFDFTSVEGASAFTLPPMSGSEIGALALFLNSSSQYFGQIIFDHIPGFRVSSKPINSSSVTFTFQADSELLAFMGIEGSANLAHVTLNTTQIHQLADDLIEVSANCK